MGQRLNIEIFKNGEIIANAYYHWSGYTRSSIQLLQAIVKKHKEIIEAKTEYTDEVLAYELLSATGATPNDDEQIYMKKTDAFRDILPSSDTIHVNRNNGLISFSPKGILDTRFWEEARASYDIGECTCKLRAWYITRRTKPIREYNEMVKECHGLENMPDLTKFFEKFNFESEYRSKEGIDLTTEQLDELGKIFDESCDAQKYTFKATRKFKRYSKKLGRQVNKSEIVLINIIE